MLAGVLVSRTQPHVGAQRTSALEARRIPELGDEDGSSGVADAANGGQELADLMLLELAGNVSI